MILETTVKRTPQAFRKAFNIPEPSEEPTQTYSSKFLNLFSSNKKRRQSLKKRNRKSPNKKKSLPLTKENLEKFYSACNENYEPQKQNKPKPVIADDVEWGSNFEYSFLVEPATSDVELDTINYISFNNSLDSSIEILKSPLVPIFRIDPPTQDEALSSNSISSLISTNSANSIKLRQQVSHPACDYVNHLIKCSYAKTTKTNSLRRSMSDPMTNISLSPFELSDGELEGALQMDCKETQNATIKDLSKKDVSR